MIVYPICLVECNWPVTTLEVRARPSIHHLYELPLLRGGLLKIKENASSG